MALISMDLNQVRHIVSTLSSSGNTLNDICGHLQHQWTSLSLTWEGDSKYDIAGTLRASLNHGRHCAEFTHERGSKLVQIADRFQAADESVAFAVQVMAWSGAAELLFSAENNLASALEQSFKEIFRMKWANMSTDERLVFLQDQHDALAKKYGIEPVKIYFEDLPDLAGQDALGVTKGVTGLLGVIGQLLLGEKGKQHIAIDIDNINSDDPWEIQNTLMHETRHVMQYYFVEHSDQRPANITEEQIKSWRDNFDNYRRPEDDFQAYRDQPVEQDARNFGDQYVTDYYNSPEEFDQIRGLTRQATV